MPGWVRDMAGAVDDSAGGAEMDGVSHPEQRHPAPQRASPDRSSSGKVALTQSQRDELIAEVLGDVVALSDRVTEIAAQMQSLNQALAANDFVRWRNALDLKISELVEINLSEQAAKRLQSFAQAYIGQLAKETNTLVAIETKRAVSDTLAFNKLFDKLNKDWLLRVGAIAGVCFISTITAHALWAML